MKVSMLAVLGSALLAIWLPIQAQQSNAPATPPQQSQAQADDSTKAPAKHDACCPAKSQTAPGATTEDHSAMGCCHGKTANEAKASCCQIKDAKDMACCSKSNQDTKAAMNCCKDMKDGQCAGKDGKSCCQNMTAKTGKTCCEGMSDHCPAHASGK